jgi:murein DD-endopeptidase MepM/ murein hydrolase activator NlpD/transcriptional regulator with XRE-family HTH domain
MPNIRSLRLSRGMTLVELALEAGIPARTLGALEHGHARLDPESATRLACSLGVAPELLYSAHSHATERIASGRRLQLSRCCRAVSLLAGALVSVLLVTQAPLWQAMLVASAPAGVTRSATISVPSAPPPTATSAPEHRRSPPTPLVAPLRGAFAALSASLPPAPTAAPPAMSATLPAFRLEADGPHGCPLVTAGSIVITQGYGEGTHAPAETWGALDLAVDGDGDGIPDPAATDGVPIVATHAGVARVYPMSWPGGNFVLVEDAQSGWSTGYAHLSVIAVADGQFIEAGATLGNVGSTGQATGPHLHYEVRHGGVNLDPSGLVTCWG